MAEIHPVLCTVLADGTIYVSQSSWSTFPHDALAFFAIFILNIIKLPHYSYTSCSCSPNSFNNDIFQQTKKCSGRTIAYYDEKVKSASDWIAADLNQ